MEKTQEELEKIKSEKLTALFDFHYTKKWEGREACIKEMNTRKQELLKEYGKEPTICYYYYLYNAIDYAGEECVRASFESIKGQGDEIIVGDYSSTDGTKELAEEYGFKVLNIEKEKGIPFAQGKTINLVIHNSKCNFLADLDIHIVYPKNFTDIIVNWIKENDITKKILMLVGFWINEEGKLQPEYGFCSSMLFYRPHFLEVRGFDERTWMGFGSGHYIAYIVLNVLNLEFVNLHLDDMIHSYHIKEKRRVMKDLFNITDFTDGLMNDLTIGKKFANKLIINFKEGVKNVKNSYW